MKYRNPLAKIRGHLIQVARRRGDMFDEFSSANTAATYLAECGAHTPNTITLLG